MATYTGEQLGKALQTPASLLLDEAIEVYVSETDLRTNEAEAQKFRAKVLSDAEKAGLSADSLAQEYIKQAGDKDVAAVLDNAARKIASASMGMDAPSFNFGELVEEKAPAPAKSLTAEDLAKKAKAGSLTLGEAISYAESRPSVSDNAKRRISALRSGIEKAGLSADTLYSDLRKEEVWQKFSKEGGGANRFGNLQALEKVIRPSLQGAGVLSTQVEVEGLGMVDAYPQITGEGGVSGGTQRTGLAGERPMRGLVPRAGLDEIYSQALPKIAETDPATAAAVEYHRATGNRIEQIVGTGGIKKDDVRVDGDTVTVRGVTRGKKTRPDISYPIDSPIGQLIINARDTATTDMLFNTSPAKFNTAFRQYISPSLLAGYEDVLPLVDKQDPSKGVISTPSAIRSIIPKMLRDEFKVPEDLVKGLMGHTDVSILSKNYAGQPAAVVAEIGNIVQGYSAGAATSWEGAGIGSTSQGFIDRPVQLTPEQQTKVAEAQVAEASVKQSSAELERMKVDAQKLQWLQSEEGQAYLKGQQELEMQEVQRKAQLADEKARLQAENREQRKAEKAAQQEAENERPPHTMNDEQKAGFGRYLDMLKNAGKIAMAGLGVTAITGAATSRYSEAKERGASTPQAMLEGAGVGLYEAVEPLPVAMMQSQPAGEQISPERQAVTIQRQQMDEVGGPVRMAPLVQEQMSQQLQNRGMAGPQMRSIDDEASELFGQ
jgi:hypothetical protein